MRGRVGMRGSPPRCRRRDSGDIRAGVPEKSKKLSGLEIFFFRHVSCKLRQGRGRQSPVWGSGLALGVFGRLTGLGAAGLTAGLTLLLSGCLYLEELPTPLVVNRPPVIENSYPAESPVDLSAYPGGRVTFQVFYSDPDEPDVAVLALVWVLTLTFPDRTESREVGYGSALPMTLETMNGAERGQLRVAVQDPQGLQARLYWDLEATASGALLEIIDPEGKSAEIPLERYEEGL